MPAIPVDMVIPIYTGGASARVDADVAPKFKAGDGVVARNLNPSGHTAARLRKIMAFSACPIPWPMAAAKPRSTFIACASVRAKCGVPAHRRGTATMSTCGTIISTLREVRENRRTW